MPAGLVARAVANLDPGSFAWVMASGTISVGTDLLGYEVLSQILLGITVAAFCGLVLAYVVRAARYTEFLRLDFNDPLKVVTSLTFVAGADVLGLRLLMAGHPAVAAGLASAGALAWIALNYGLPWTIVARAHRPVLRDFDGTWLIWVVATESLAIMAAGLVASTSDEALRQGLAEAALCLWGLGIVFYLALMGIILLRLVTVEVTPKEMGPAYWITMGATAISVRAAAGIVVLPDRIGTFPAGEFHTFVVGVSVVLWSFGTWCIPLLVLFGFWRHVLCRYPIAYEPPLWSLVFPLGMYAVASYSFGRAADFQFMVSIARAWVWVGVVAWCGVLALMAWALLRAVAGHGRLSS